jgi:hypothetical protein
MVKLTVVPVILLALSEALKTATLAISARVMSRLFSSIIFVFSALIHHPVSSANTAAGDVGIRKPTLVRIQPYVSVTWLV